MPPVAALAEARERGTQSLVLRSAGPVFCSGVNRTEPMPLDAGSPELVVVDAQLESGMLVVTVAEGPALAGGLVVAAISTVTIASDHALTRSIWVFPARVLAYLEEVVPARQAALARAGRNSGRRRTERFRARRDRYDRVLARTLGRDQPGWNGTP